MMLTFFVIVSELASQAEGGCRTIKKVFYKKVLVVGLCRKINLTSHMLSKQISVHFDRISQTRYL